MLQIIGFIVLCGSAFLGFGVLSDRYDSTGEENASVKAGLIGMGVVVATLILGWTFISVIAAVAPWVLVALDETNKRNGNGGKAE